HRWTGLPTSAPSPGARLGSGAAVRIRAATQQPIVPTERLPQDDALLADLEGSKVFTVGAPAHFHDGDDPLQLTLQFDIALHDDRIGQKSRAVRAEAQI